MKFIDLFAGLGCFHQALARLGHECVYACEINPMLNELYEKNWGVSPDFDIREVEVSSIPKHDILCAGFPCQPFSHAAPTYRLKGFECPENGDLFSWIVKILRSKTPKYFILENAPFLENHDGGRTWETMETMLRSIGYEVKKIIFSHQKILAFLIIERDCLLLEICRACLCFRPYQPVFVQILMTTLRKTPVKSITFLKNKRSA